jgi:hypothetical protein
MSKPVVTNSVKTSTWSVRFTLPKDESKGRKWAQNGCVTCVCDTAEKAIQLLRDEHEDAVVHNVNHKGHDFTLIDPVLKSNG